MAHQTGMNIDQVRDYARQLDGQAEQIRGQLINQMNSILGGLEGNWAGPDFVQFKGWWEQEHRPRLMKIAEDIAGLAQSARNNAQEQEQVSGR